jgi:hypothetical protein
MTWRLVLLLLLTLAAWANPAAAADRAAPFTEARLRELLAHNPQTGRPVDSVSELVPLLPEELRRNFTFVYESRSPFKAAITPQRPRVILFTDDARLVLTFIGDDTQPGADLLESMSFDDEQAKFVFSAYLLPAAERRAWRPTAAEAKCARCHGADPRPIYDSYPLWPGYYGSVLDTFPRDRHGQKERENFAAFAAGAAKDGVYKDLIYPQGSPVTPFLDPRLFKDNTIELDPALLPFLPNARLGIALTELNRQRIYRKLVMGPGFAANEKKMLALLLECRPSDRPSRKDMLAIFDALTRENAARVKRLGVLASDPHKDRNDMQELMFVRELAEVDEVARIAGVDRSDWSMALEPGSLAFFDGVLSGISNGKSYYLKEDLIFEMLSHLAEREPIFAQYLYTDNALSDYGYPFGTIVDLATAARSCPLLTAPGPQAVSSRLGQMGLRLATRRS